MLKKFFHILSFSLLFLIGCKSLPYETSKLLDTREDETFISVSFDANSPMKFHTLHIELLETESAETINALITNIRNSMDSPVKIKAILENEESEPIAYSETLSIDPDDSDCLLFHFSPGTEEETVASITLFIQGKLTDGYINFENIKLLRN